MAAKKSPFSGLDRSKTLAENTLNAGPVVLDSNVKVASPDGTGFSDGVLFISLANATPDDHLSIAEVGGITLGTDPSGHTIAFYEGVQIGIVMTGRSGLTVLLGEPVDDAAMTALARAVAYSCIMASAAQHGHYRWITARLRPSAGRGLRAIPLPPRGRRRRRGVVWCCRFRPPPRSRSGHLRAPMSYHQICSAKLPDRESHKL